jgi:hypothetical protein
MAFFDAPGEGGNANRSVPWVVRREGLAEALAMGNFRLSGAIYDGEMASRDSVLSAGKYDVVHFNNGMHEWGYTEERYRSAFPEFVASIRKGAPAAKLTCATTTEVREKDHLENVADRTARVKERNRIAAEVVTEEDPHRRPFRVGQRTSRVLPQGRGPL